MNKNIFKDYIDACELEKELEERIRKLEEGGIAHDVVSGSNPEYPYQAQHFHVEGAVQQVDRNAEWENLKRQQEKVKQIRQKCEEIMEKAPVRIQRIIQYKWFDRLSWNQVAEKLGSNVSVDSIKKEYQRFIKKI